MPRRPSDPARCLLAFDARSRCPAHLGDAVFPERTVKEVASLAGMRILKLNVSNIEEDLGNLNAEVLADEGGISVQALISTSHIALHTWPAWRAFMFDLVSCRSFDSAEVISNLKRVLEVAAVVHEKVTDVERGIAQGIPGPVDQCAVARSAC